MRNTCSFFSDNSSSRLCCSYYTCNVMQVKELFYLSVWVCMCVCVGYGNMSVGAYRGRRGHQMPRSLGDCELLHVGGGKQTSVLCMGSTDSWVLSWLSPVLIRFFVCSQSVFKLTHTVPFFYCFSSFFDFPDGIILHLLGERHSNQACVACL